MRRVLKIAPLLFFWVLLVAMAKPPGPEVPTPDIDFKATVRDDQDVATKVSHASWEGNVFFTGVRGKGLVTISFEKVKKLSSMNSSNGNRSDFQVTLKNGDVVAVSLESDERLLGTTSFGTYRIAAKNIKEIVFE